MEGFVPEQFFSTENAPAQTASAVSAIAQASAEGQKILTITSENQSATLPLLTIDQIAYDEIIAGLNAGMTVTTHESPITVGSWQGSGYLVLDHDTGAGAYKISGGYNGSITSDAQSTPESAGIARLILGSFLPSAHASTTDVAPKALDVLESFMKWHYVKEKCEIYYGDAGAEVFAYIFVIAKVVLTLSIMFLIHRILKNPGALLLVGGVIGAVLDKLLTRYLLRPCGIY